MTVGFVKGYFVVTYPLAPSLIYYVKGRGSGKGGGFAPSLKSLSETEEGYTLQTPSLSR
jgi:hypothetical protein